MKILIVHNDYGKRSGEEAVVEKMAEIFTGLGHDVAQLRMSTAEARESLAGKIRVFTAGLHSPAGVRAMREALERERPDVVNVHNVYPFISPAALRECRSAGVPVVMTIHNFRLICPTGLFMRDGKPCELCLHRGNEWGCVKYNCEKSWPKSIAYATRNALARRRRHFFDCVDRFACITEFQRGKLIEAGFPADRISVIPNGIEVGGKGLEVRNKTNLDYVGFVGRLSAEKGINLIIEAARRNPDIPFRLAGAVSDEQLVAKLPANVNLTGFIAGKELEDFYRNSRFMIMASKWYEGFPMSILEGAARDKATIGPDHGGFTEILTLNEAPCENGNPLLFKPGDIDDLSAHIRRLWDDKELAERLGKMMERKLREEYATDVVAAKWGELLQGIHPVAPQ